MAKIKTFDSTTVRQVREILQEAMNKLKEKHGLSIDVGNIRYSAEHVDVKMEIVLDDGSGADAYEQRLASDARKFAFSYGINAEMIGKKADIPNRGLCTFLGVTPRASKYPLVWKEANGQRFKSSEAYLKMFLKD